MRLISEISVQLFIVWPMTVQCARTSTRTYCTCSCDLKMLICTPCTHKHISASRFVFSTCVRTPCTYFSCLVCRHVSAWSRQAEGCTGKKAQAQESVFWSGRSGIHQRGSDRHEALAPGSVYLILAWQVYCLFEYNGNRQTQRQAQCCMCRWWDGELVLLCESTPVEICMSIQEATDGMVDACLGIQTVIPSFSLRRTCIIARPIQHKYTDMKGLCRHECWDCQFLFLCARMSTFVRRSCRQARTDRLKDACIEIRMMSAWETQLSICLSVYDSMEAFSLRCLRLAANI